MLIHQNRIAIRIDNNETSNKDVFRLLPVSIRPFVFELPLEVPDIGKKNPIYWHFDPIPD